MPIALNPQCSLKPTFRLPLPPHTEFPMINVNKVWFYSTAMAVVIAGVYFSLPSEEQQAKMQAAAAKKKAQRAAAKRKAAAQAQPASAPASAAHAR